uniref:Uncharacterized protein n=1 Tax=Solanum lycopersicum TaxID=4081 RepID=A0A3Q7H861_SOLLC
MLSYKNYINRLLRLRLRETLLSPKAFLWFSGEGVEDFNLKVIRTIIRKATTVANTNALLKATVLQLE